MIRYLCLVAVLMVSFGLSAGYGQATDAAISGTVRDGSGASVPGALVAAENKKTGVVARSSANASGLYSFPGLTAGGGGEGLP